MPTIQAIDERCIVDTSFENFIHLLTVAVIKINGCTYTLFHKNRLYYVNRDCGIVDWVESSMAIDSLYKEWLESYRNSVRYV